MEKCVCVGDILWVEIWQNKVMKKQCSSGARGKVRMAAGVDSLYIVFTSSLKSYRSC